MTAGPSQLPLSIRWQTPVDLDPQYSGDELLIHYGSPAITAANNIIVPFKTGAAGGFSIKGINATDGQSDLDDGDRLCAAAAQLDSAHGSNAYARTARPWWLPEQAGRSGCATNPNAAQGTTTRLAFFGSKFYNQNPNAFNSAIQICTPITCDSSDSLYFGYLSTGQALPGYPRGIPSGLARVDLVGRWHVRGGECSGG